MRLYSYVVARDFGFAPNPFHGVCTLATCKPRIRSVAQIGDWVLGTGSKSAGREKRAVYAMRVTGTLTFEEYWADARFQGKKPNLRGSKKQAFGDNIYYRSPDTRRWCQLDSHHSLNDGSPNPANIKTDTGTDRMLYSDDFVYWGGSGPELPAKFLNYGPGRLSILARRNHRTHFPVRLGEEFVSWIRSRNETGYCGEPLEWKKTA
jgi:hypothetical protein